MRPSDSAKRQNEHSIATRLESVRRAAGLTQAAFALQIGVPKRTYLGWERNEREPPISLLDALEREFGVDPIWLIRGGAFQTRVTGQVDKTQLYEALGAVDREIERHDHHPSRDQFVSLVAEVYELLTGPTARIRELIAKDLGERAR